MDTGTPRSSRLLEVFAVHRRMAVDGPFCLCDAWAMATDLTLGDAARAIGVSVDTLRRWDTAGKVRTTRDERNRRRVPRSEVERLTARPPRHTSGDGLSARNRFPGVVRSVEVDGVMALVEIEAGPHRVIAAITRDAVEELGLTAGVRATAAVKATSVMVERGAA
jgi:molybdopterin-binding protein